MVQAIMAGGSKALKGPAEGAEDSASAGARDLKRTKVSQRDVVVGITASGNTPYVLGALKLARRRGAVTVGVTSNVRFAAGSRGANHYRAGHRARKQLRARRG